MDLVFNELSLVDLPNNDINAKVALDRLLNLLSKIKSDFKVSPSFLSNEPILNLSLSKNNYSLLSWLTQLNKEEKQFFLTVASKKPFIKNYPYYFFNGVPTKGFGFAYENNLITISFDPENKWKENIYHIDKHFLDEETEDFSEENNLPVYHLANCELNDFSIELINQEIQNQSKFENLNISSGIDFEEKLGDLFPKLKFTEQSRNAIKALKTNDPHIKPIYNQLLELNNFFLNWSGKPENYGELLPSKTTPESATRRIELNNKLIILCPDGNTRHFDWHQRYTPGPGRIYFEPDTEDRFCYIGYIGDKLIA